MARYDANAMRHHTNSRRLSFRLLLVVFLIGLLLRAGYGGWQMSRADGAAALQFPDEQQYWAMAGQLRQGELLTDELGFHATRMPLYPALLSLWAGSDRGVIGVRVCQWLVGALAAVLAACLASRVAGTGVGLICGLLVAAAMTQRR